MSNEPEGQLFKCGYCGWLISRHCEVLWEHDCFIKTGFNESSGVLSVDNNNVVTVIAKRFPKNMEIDETLINEVCKRRPLYDHRIPRMARTSLKLKDLWNEIKNCLGEGYSIEFVQKRWKSLRDEYVRCRKKMNAYRPSGSEAEAGPSVPSFKYYALMKFLDDVLDRTPTTSNIATPESDVGDSDSRDKPGSSRDGSSQPKKRKASEQVNEAILDILKKDDRLEGVDGFLIRLGEGLKRLPYKNRSRLEIKFLTLLQEEEEALGLE